MSIEFYDVKDAYGEFSNFYGTKEDKQFKLIIDGKSWLSTEHYYQSQKFKGSTDADEYANLVAKADTANKCFVLARQKKLSGFKINWKLTVSDPIKLSDIINEYLKKGVTVRNDWSEIKESVMNRALQAKFAQNPHLLNKLLATQNNKLVEHTKRDNYWGDGGNGQGLNKLGEMLMNIRQQYQSKTKIKIKLKNCDQFVKN